MIEFCGAPLTSSQYGRKCTDHLNLAWRRMFAWAPVDEVSIAHSPLANLASAWLWRPAYVNSPFFARSASIAIWRTWSGVLNVKTVSSPAIPFSFVPMGTLCHAEKFSMCVHEGHPVVYTQPCPAAFILSASAMNSFQVLGACAMPAFLKSSSLV